jgi:hypothetical protein
MRKVTISTVTMVANLKVPHFKQMHNKKRTTRTINQYCIRKKCHIMNTVKLIATKKEDAMTEIQC